jgi:spore maturation protein SpmA
MTGMTALKQESSRHAAESFGAQAPIALLGLAAIAIIALINANSRPTPVVQPQIVASACASCGTVVAVRRSAHSSPVYFVEVQMLDGSTRVVQQLAAGFKVGDVVLVNGNALSLRPQPS